MSEGNTFFPKELADELIEGEDYIPGYKLIAKALKLRSLPYPSDGSGHLSERQLIQENEILVDDKGSIVLFKELGYEGIKELQVLFNEFREEQNIDEKFARMLIERIPELYEPNLLLPPSGHHGSPSKYVFKERQLVIKERWKKRRYYLKNKI